MLLPARGESSEAQLRFDPAPNTAYVRALEILVEVERAGFGYLDFCFARLGRYRHFDKSWRNKPMSLSLVMPEPVPPALDRATVPRCDPIKVTPQPPDEVKPLKNR